MHLIHRTEHLSLLLGDLPRGSDFNSVDRWWNWIYEIFFSLNPPYRSPVGKISSYSNLKGRRLIISVGLLASIFIFFSSQLTVRAKSWTTLSSHLARQWANEHWEFFFLILNLPVSRNNLESNVCYYSCEGYTLRYVFWVFLTKFIKSVAEVMVLSVDNHLGSCIMSHSAYWYIFLTRALSEVQPKSGGLIGAYLNNLIRQSLRQ